jgi:hypothetical protein
MDLFQPLIGELSHEHKGRLMRYIMQWNTNTKTSTEAQVLLHVIFKTVSEDDLQLLEPTKLLPYTDKHLTRLKKMQQQMMILEFFSNIS